MTRYSTEKPYILNLNLLYLLFSDCNIHRFYSLKRSGFCFLLFLALFMSLVYFLKQKLIFSFNLHILSFHHTIFFVIILKKCPISKIWIIIKIRAKFRFGSCHEINFLFMNLHSMRNLLFFKHIFKQWLSQMG